MRTVSRLNQSASLWEGTVGLLGQMVSLSRSEGLDGRSLGVLGHCKKPNLVHNT